jgi:hypothetical protein
VHGQGDTATAKSKASVRIVETDVMNNDRYCHSCGQLTPEARHDAAIDARVNTFRRWCQDNNKRITPDDRVPTEVAADLVGLEAGTMKNRRNQKQRPRFGYVGKLAMYELQELADWITPRDS